MKKAIFLDFDGVLFNTAQEAYAVGMLAIGNAEQISEINFNGTHYQRFMNFRYLVGPAWNYQYIFTLLNEKDDRQFHSRYLEEIIAAKKSAYTDFEKAFFASRADFKHDNYSEWLKLNKPYKFFLLLKQELQKSPSDFNIITTKDKGTVMDIFKANGLNFNPSNIYDKDDFEMYKNKAEIAKHIMETEKISKAIFVDDNVEHLKPFKYLRNVETFHAGWGYISNEVISPTNDLEVIDAIKNR